MTVEENMTVSRRFLLLIPLLFLTAPSFACGENEYEQCWRIELPFGAEARDCKCLPKIPGPIADGPEMLKPHIAQLASEIQKSPEAMLECIADVQKCANEIISAPLALPVKAYIEYLYQQSQGRTYSFSPEFVSLVQQHFDVNVAQLTFANDIDTLHGQSVSYCDRIFFTGHGNLWKDKDELRHVLHEIEHTIQCQRRGKSAYLAEYVLKATAEVIKNGRLNVHDLHDYEVAAENKANQLTDLLWKRINSGSVPVPEGQYGPTNGGLPPAPSPQNRFPAGFIIQGCGCWGPVFGAISAPACFSGAAYPQACPGACFGGGSPYGFVCD